MVLKTLLISKRQKKGDEEKEKRERVPDDSMKLIGVFFKLSGVLYLYRDHVTVLEKIATIVTLMDKIKMKFIH